MLYTALVGAQSLQTEEGVAAGAVERGAARAHAAAGEEAVPTVVARAEAAAGAVAGAVTTGSGSTSESLRKKKRHYHHHKGSSSRKKQASKGVSISKGHKGHKGHTGAASVRASNKHAADERRGICSSCCWSCHALLVLRDCFFNFPS